ncbi:UNVERIFIED_CONTAM: hypothetical protein NY603_37955, partial [Bacteroidetes bacterium 56_B9]
VTATTLLLCDCNEVSRIILLLDVGVVVKASLCTLFSFTEMYAFLFWVMRLLGLATVTLDMRRPLLALETTVLALRNGSPL